MLKTLGCLLALVLFASACGGDGGSDLSDEEQALADAVAVQLTEDSDDFASAEEAECYGEGVVSEMGFERMVELGLDQAAVESGTSPEDVELSDEDIDALLDPMIECIDFAAVFSESLTSGSDVQVSEDSADCIANGISDETIELAARSSLTGEELDADTNQEVLTEMFDLMSDCLTPEEFQAVTGG